VAPDLTGKVPITQSMAAALLNSPLKGETLFSSDRIRKELPNNPSRQTIHHWIHEGCTVRRSRETIRLEVFWVGSDRWVSSLEAVSRFLAKLNDDGGEA